LDGSVVTRAAQSLDYTGNVEVTLRMNAAGAKKWAELTTKAANEGNREIAIVLDDEVVSAPRVNQPITGGNSSITGNYTVDEAVNFASILEVGKLPAGTKIVQEMNVGPSLGKDNIDRSINSLLIGFALVIITILVYYSFGGVLALLSLLLNIFIIFGTLSSFGTVLTLSGIAGIVLTIGMAVDANVIIFERIKEELNDGKSLKQAISDGFYHSYSAIIDANVTTILTAIILAYFGLGPVKGFAIVLIIGVVSSMFTAIFVTRMLIDWWIGQDRDLPFWSGISKGAFKDVTFDWISKRRIAYIFSGVIIAAGIVSIMTRGFDFGVDYKGGFSYTVQFTGTESINADDLRTGLSDVFGAPPVVKQVDTENSYNITTSYLINENTPETAEKVIGKLHEGIVAITKSDVSLDVFKDSGAENQIHVLSSAQVGPTIASDLKRSSLYAGVFALIVVFLYILLRFSKWQYSAGAIVAVFHDSLVVLSVFSLLYGVLPFSLEIDQAFIAAILTVIGYSLNDTVIIFDRIRENLGIHVNKDKDEVINMAINSTLSRTIMTSFTTVVVVLILFLFGGASIKGFAFALLVGIVVGTYSSVFIAAPVLHDLGSDLRIHVKKSK
jgi:SecD/SecF fusion protein